MNGQTVYLDVDYAMEDGGGPITHLWLMDESGDNPDQTFVPEERAIAAETERDRLRKSLERAAGIIADICGECPVSHYEWLSSDGCAEKFGTVTKEECWIAYLTGKRWDESGAEVDG